MGLAEEMHNRALNGLQKFFSKLMPDGRKHSLTLLAMHNLGDHLRQIGKNNEAMDVLLEAYQGRIEKLGGTHKRTEETKALLEKVTEALRAAGGRVRIQSFNPEKSRPTERDVGSAKSCGKRRRTTWHSKLP